MEICSIGMPPLTPLVFLFFILLFPFPSSAQSPPPPTPESPPPPSPPPPPPPPPPPLSPPPPPQPSPPPPPPSLPPPPRKQMRRPPHRPPFLTPAKINQDRGMNLGKKIGFLFAGIAVFLQIGALGFLLFKRNQLFKPFKVRD